MKRFIILLMFMICTMSFSIEIKLEKFIDYKTILNSIVWIDNKTFFNGINSQLYKCTIDNGNFVKLFQLYENDNNYYNLVAINSQMDTIICIIKEPGIKGKKNYIIYNVLNDSFLNLDRENFLSEKIKILQTQSRGQMWEDLQMGKDYWEIDLINAYRLAYYDLDETGRQIGYKSFVVKDQYGKEIIKAINLVKAFYFVSLSQLALNPAKNRLLISGYGYDKLDNEKEASAHYGLWLFHIIYDSEVIKDNATIFENADINSKQIEKIKKDDEVKIYERSDNEVEYEGKKDYLYQIQLKDGTKGWCFGDYLRVDYPIDRIVGEKVVFYNPKVDKLRLREKQGLGGKIMKELSMTDKLELVGIGKEAEIDKIKGKWVEVRTEQGEIGWCFDGYLEEVKTE